MHLKSFLCSSTGTLFLLVILQLSFSAVLASTSEVKKKSEKLVFNADCNLEIEAPCETSQVSALKEFLEDPSTRKYFLSAGGKRPCTEVPLDAHVRSLWRKACHKYYGDSTYPSALLDGASTTSTGNKNPSGLVAMATETEVQFPGFKTINTVLNGCKLIHDKNGQPVYEFFVIGDKKRMVGSPPIVWLVRKLTGEGSTSSKNFQPSETKAYTRVSFQSPSSSAASSSSSPMAKVCLDVQCAIQVEFPKLLLKLLPAPKSKVEEKGTNSIRKVVLKDANEAVEAVQRAWLEQKDARILEQKRQDSASRIPTPFSLL